MNTWIQTYAGKKFDYAFHDPDAVNIDDIIVSLSRTVRFRGMTPRPYTVLEHSLIGAMSVENNDELALQFLIHDMGEAYIGDIPTPLKNCFGDVTRRDLEEIEQDIINSVIKKYQLPIQFADIESMKLLDALMLEEERNLFFPLRPDDWKLPALSPQRIYEQGINRSKIKRLLKSSIIDIEKFKSMFFDLRDSING